MMNHLSMIGETWNNSINEEIAVINDIFLKLVLLIYLSTNNGLEMKKLVFIYLFHLQLSSKKSRFREIPLSFLHLYYVLL